MTTKDSKTQQETKKPKETRPGDQVSKMRRLFGFDLNDFSSWDSFVKLLMRPEDPASLAAFRILFGNFFVIKFFYSYSTQKSLK